MQPTARQSMLATVGWWSVTLAMLMVLDDLTFGPLYWLIGGFTGATWAVVCVYLTYVPVQVYLVWKGTADDPGTVANWFLTRLDLGRRHARIVHNELRLRRRVVGAASAVGLSLVIGGVLPPLLLYRQGFPRTMVMRLSVLTAFLYATEFAFLHGYLPTLL